MAGTRSLIKVTLLVPAVITTFAPPTAAQARIPADLLPTPISADGAFINIEVIQKGDKIHFDSGVANLGDAEAGVFNIKWIVDDQDIGAYGSHAGIPGRSEVLDGNSQFDWAFQRAGTYFVDFIVDVDNHIAEFNELNNKRSVQVTVGESKCVAVRFVGVHGVGERPENANLFMGPAVFEQYAAFKAAADAEGATVLPGGVAYPTITVQEMVTNTVQFATDVVVGARILAKEVEATQEGCVVLVGYSEGAQVVHMFLQGNPKLVPRIAAVYLLGDPQFDNDAASFVAGATRYDGVIRSQFPNNAIEPFFPPYLQGHARSYCLGNSVLQDPVCNWGGANFPGALGQHTAYASMSSDLVAFVSGLVL